MENLFKSFADELEERRLAKGDVISLDAARKKKAEATPKTGTPAKSPWSGKPDKNPSIEGRVSTHESRVTDIADIRSDIDKKYTRASREKHRAKHLERLKNMSPSEVSQEHADYFSQVYDKPKGDK